MTQVAVYPDAEAVAVAWLRERFALLGDPAHVGTMVPNPRPERFIRVMLAGAQTTPPLQEAMLIFDCWDRTSPLASGLARLAQGLIGALDGVTVGGVFCYGVGYVGGPSNLPDPDTTLARYLFTSTVSLRCAVL